MTMTASQKIQKSITTQLRARVSLFWVITPEERRALTGIIESAGEAGYETRIWNCSKGLRNADGKVLDAGMNDPQRAMQHISASRERAVFVLCDLHRWLVDPVTIRALKDLALDLQSCKRGEARSVFVLSPSREVPPDYEGLANVVEWPRPDKEELRSLLAEAVEELPADMPARKASAKQRDEVADAAAGLLAEQAATAFSCSIIETRDLDPKLVSAEKRKLVATVQGLEWIEPDPRGLDAVGGYGLLKRFVLSKLGAFGPEAREYGVPQPKGLMLAGISGCGKTHLAKCLASSWGAGVPLLKADPGSAKSKYVGESEGNFDRILAVVSAAAPCVLYIDEAEKIFARGGEDGGVSEAYLAKILSWQQDRTAPVYVIFTCNEPDRLPSEFARKGRVDETFWIDLPYASERAEILGITIAQFKRDPKKFDCVKVAALCDGFNGAEMANLVAEALGAAFADGRREPTTTDLIKAARDTVPLSKTSAEKIDAMRTWAKGRTKSASDPETVSNNNRKTRTLDL